MTEKQYSGAIGYPESRYFGVNTSLLNAFSGLVEALCMNCEKELDVDTSNQEGRQRWF